MIEINQPNSQQPKAGSHVNYVRGCILALVLLIAIPFASRAQTSVVPLTHPVYEWLHFQRVAGRITDYHVEQAPYSRADIARFLKTIKKSDRLLTRFDKHTLQSYRKEFDPDLLRKASIRSSWNRRKGVGRKLAGLWIDQPEPYLFRYTSKDRSLETYLYYSRGRAEVNAWDDGDWRWARYYVKGINGFLNAGKHVGFHAYIDNVFALGDYHLMSLDPEWGHSYYIDQMPVKDRASYSYEVFSSFSYGMFDVDLGRGSLEFGPSVSDPLLFRREAPNMNWLRLSLGNAKVNFMYMHGSLQSYVTRSNITVNGRPGTTRTAPSRWFALHRLTIEPIPQLTMGFYELVMYSNRPMDLMYLNPVMPYVFSELDAGNMDKNLMGADIRIRPFRGNELFATLLIDDLLDIPSLFKLENTKVGMNFGFHQNLPLSSQIGGSYTRIDAHMYSHTSTLNTMEVARKPLAHPLGPNSEEWAAKWTTWLPFRSRIIAEYQIAKKGLNPVDEEGNVTKNVGGDLLLDGLTVFNTLYDGADVQKLAISKLEVRTEPMRGLQLSVRAWDHRILRGDRMKPFRYVDFRFGFGF